MELTLFQIAEKTILLQKIQHLLHVFYMAMAFIFGVNEDIIQVNNDKDIKLLG